MYVIDLMPIKMYFSADLIGIPFVNLLKSELFWLDQLIALNTLI